MIIVPLTRNYHLRFLENNILIANTDYFTSKVYNKLNTYQIIWQ